MCAEVSAKKPSEEVTDKPENGGSSETKQKEENQDVQDELDEQMMPTGTPKSKKQNPFKLPDSVNYTKLLEEEKCRTTTKFKKMLRRPTHRKSPARQLSPINVLRTISSLPEPSEPPPSPTSAIKSDPEFQQALAKGEKLRNMENLTTFVNNKREMFLIQYMIGVKRDEMLRLVQREHEEEKRLNKAEKWLEDDAVKFSDFLRNNDREAVDAVKQAEMETKQKLDKATEIKKINIHIVNLKSNISKLEDVLTEYKLYAKFLTSVAPQEWKEQKLRERQQRVEQKAKALAESFKEQSDRTMERGPIEKSNKRVHIAASTASILQVASQSKKPQRRVREKMSACTIKDLSTKDHDSDDQGTSNSTLLSEMIVELQLSSEVAQYLMEEEEDEKAELFFTDPGQLAGIFAELEEQNLILIQKIQETEETLEEVQAAFNHVQLKLEKETKLLSQQVALVERLLEWEVKKAKEFEIMAKMYSFGEFNEDIQEKMLCELQAKIESVFAVILGPNDANLNAIQMLTAIEAHLEFLLESLEVMQPSKFEAALRTRERQRRLLIREARSNELREYLLQRQLRTMAKATTVTKGLVARKLLSRSEPPHFKKRAQRVKWKSRDEEEAQYFFT